MVIEKLVLNNFKNYEIGNFEFSPEINLITGTNGSGKTNLLDAIHYISLTKSAFNVSDSQTIRNDNNFFSIISTILINGKNVSILCSFQEGSKKNIKVNKVGYDKISEHIGRFPVVLITPYDVDIIRGGSEDRRKFFDTIISQLDQTYLNTLISYNHHLKQRNALLKSYTHISQADLTLLEYYNGKLEESGTIIYGKRKSFMGSFEMSFQDFYQKLSNHHETVELTYTSQIENAPLGILLKDSLNKDILLQRTTTGIHKDDYLFKINKMSLKNFGSQGQQKSFIISLKLSQFKTFTENKGFKPVLLLDDIFDKLDDLRIERILAMVKEKYFGQIFITDARIDIREKFTNELTTNLAIFKIDKGSIVYE